MRKIIAIIIAICLLGAGNPIPSYAKEGHKKHHKHKKIKKHRHKKRERELKMNTGHTEFKNRSKKERRQLSRYHIKPVPEDESKGSKKVGGDKKGDQDEADKKDKPDEQEKKSEDKGGEQDKKDK